MFVTGEEQLDQVVDELSHCSEFAIDLEVTMVMFTVGVANRIMTSQNHSYRSFQGFVCLMQISTRNHDYIIDTLELRHHMHNLLDVFTNPSIVKVTLGVSHESCDYHVTSGDARCRLGYSVASERLWAVCGKPV